MDVLRVEDGQADEVVEGVFNTKLVDGENMNLLRFEIRPGDGVPRHDHPHEQVGYIVSGRATFVTDDGERTIEAGDSYAIPGDEPHALENRTDEPVVGVDVFSPPRSFAPFAEDS